MIKYRIIPATDEEAINDFLDKNGNGIPTTGITFHEGNICFVYTSADEKIQTRESMIASLDQLIGKRRAEILGMESDIRYWRVQALAGIEGAAKNVVTFSDNITNSIKNLKVVEALKQEVVDGKWDDISLQTVEVK